MKAALYESDLTASTTVWRRGRIRDLQLPGDEGHAGEDFLEALIAENPEMLGLTSDDDQSHIFGPFVCRRQCEVPALNGRYVYPDILVLCQSGDVVVVEVKLGDNPELKDRRVVAQVLEYAACLAAMPEDALAAMLSNGSSEGASWPEVVASVFPRAPDPQRLANQLLTRIRSRDLHLVIACDEVPHGLRELVHGVISQQALGEYKFQVVEIAPHVSERSPQKVMLVPDVRVRTEIVARTSVTVFTAAGSPVQSVTVTTTSPEDAEQAAQGARERAAAQEWDEESFFEATADLDYDVRAGLRRAYDFFTAGNYKIWFGRGAVLGTISVGIPEVSDKAVLQLATDGPIWVYFNNMPDQVADRVRTGLKKLGIDMRQTNYGAINPESWLPTLDEVLAGFDGLRGKSS